MTGLQIPGVGSGLDIKAMVKAIADSEMAPKESALKRSEQRTESELSVLGQIFAAGSELLQACDGLTHGHWLKAHSSDPHTVIARITGQPLVGDFCEIEVRQLATHGHALSGFQTSGAVFNEGRLGITVHNSNGHQQDFIVETTQETTLPQLARQINHSDSKLSDLIRASVIRDISGERLLLSLIATGAGTTVEVKGEKGLQALAHSFATHGHQLKSGEGKDASYRLNDVAVTSHSNHITGAILGLELDLQDARAGHHVLITVQHNAKELMAELEAFTEKCTQFFRKTDLTTRGDNKMGIQSSSLVRHLTSQIDQLLGGITSHTSHIRSLADIGLIRERNGSLSLNARKLTQALQKHPADVHKLITGEQGPVRQISRVIQNMDKPSSGLQSHGRRLENDARQLIAEHRKLDLERQRITDGLLRKYIDMDQRIGKLKQVGSAIELMTDRFAQRGRER